jgi:ubiquinone/menaquinone biosynthesis C-methylase UbiE
MSHEQEFFDTIASQWDETRAPDDRKISQLVDLIGLNPGARVLDAGSGTGVLLPFLKQVIGPEGTITAVDFSSKMLAIAKEKHDRLGGIEFAAADIMHYSAGQAFDAVICFNFFPHIKDKPLFLAKMRAMLQSGGMLVIMHDISREQVNAIHQGSTAVKDDRLAPAAMVTELFTAAGFEVQKAIDAEDRYLLKGIKI